MKTALIVGLTVICVFAVVLAVLFTGEFKRATCGTDKLSISQQTVADYWTLNVSSSFGGSVSLNGLIQVPLYKSGISVTAVPSGWNGFLGWILDGQQVPDNSSTIFVPKQTVNTNHTLTAQFIIATPVPVPITTGNRSIGAHTYQAYNFTVPSSNNQVSGYFNATGAITVRIMDSNSFVNWQKGHQSATYYTSENSSCGTINLALPASKQSDAGYYLVFDNTSGYEAMDVAAQVSFFYVP